MAAAGSAPPAEQDPALLDRVCKDVPPIPRFPMKRAELMLYKAGGAVPKLDVLKAHFLREGRLETELVLSIVERVSKMLKEEPNVLRLKYPVTVCGDIHGQFFDLMKLFEVGGDPKETQYLFLGDYVDRGCFSCEVVLWLYAMKLNYPKTFFMLRGNHECRQLSAFFNFKDECVYKYNIEVYDAIMESFDHLPLAAVVDDQFFCVHGGLSPSIQTVADVERVPRHREIPRTGPMCDLLWSDPFDDDGGGGGGAADSDKKTSAGTMAMTAPTPTTQMPGFVYNGKRQCSWIYDAEAVDAFLDKNGLTSMIRAHEAQLNGYKMHMVSPRIGVPRVITIFSAPNYCDVYNNKGACIKLAPNMVNIKQFDLSPHPYYLPNFMDVFQWSLPYVAEKLTDMLAGVIRHADRLPDSESDEDEDEAETEAVEAAAGAAAAESGAREGRAKSDVLRRRGTLFKKKISAVMGWMRVYKTLREESENVLLLKQLAPNSRVPFGVIREGPEAILKCLKSFSAAEQADAVNERMPQDEKEAAAEKAAEEKGKEEAEQVGKSAAAAAPAAGGDDVAAEAAAASPGQGEAA